MYYAGDISWLFFYDGLAGVEKTFRYGFVNTKGKLVIPAKYDEITPFKNGYARVRYYGKWGYINTKGKEFFIDEI